MLLKIYRTNQPLVLVLLPIITLILWFPSLGKSPSLKLINTTFVFDFIVPSSIYFNQLLAIGILLMSAFILNNTINKNEFFHQNLYLPSFLYVLFFSASPQLHYLHPILIGNFFLILAFRRLVNIHSQVGCKSEVFDATFLLLIGGLFYPPILTFIPLSWIALFIIRPFVWKEWAVPLLAIAIFLVYYFSSFLFIENVPIYTLSQTLESSLYLNVEYSIPFLITSFFSSIFFAMGLYQIYQKRKSSTIRFKKMISSISAFFFWGLIIFIAIFIATFSFEFLFMLSVPIIIAMTYFFIYFKKNLVAEIGLSLLFVLVLVNCYLF